MSGRESLRDIVIATQAHSSKAFHLGFGKYVTRSNLSKANNSRDYRIFEDFAYHVITILRTVTRRLCIAERQACYSLPICIFYTIADCYRKKASQQSLEVSVNNI
ncbi:MAG: DUF4372 domain-containing protein [Bacteroidales bacterium]|nr:DUF4372 domain-containing protein [Bacteroidales bacterium]